MDSKKPVKSILHFGLAAMFSLLIWRLIDVQLIKGDFYRRMSDENKTFVLAVPAMRGEILDRYNQPLAFSDKQFYQVSDENTLYPKLSPLNREEALQLLATNSASVTHQYLRRYRFGGAIGAVTGFVGMPDEEDLSNELIKTNQLVGKTGLEKYFNQQLSGRDGKNYFEINAFGSKRRLVKSEQAQNGQSIYTSVDPYLSAVATKLLTGKKGAILLSDAQTGEVLTLVTSPTFDPALMAPDPLVPSQLRNQQIGDLLNDVNKPFFNRASAGQYPPGSVFKIATALAGLETDKIDAQTSVNDEGSLKVGEYEYGNWYYRQFGRTEGNISLQRAISRSNDIYFYKVAEWVGPDSLANMAKLLGFGQKPQLELTDLAAGLVPTPARKEQATSSKWFLGNTYHFGIGQGDLLVSPIQVLQLTQTVAHQGTFCPPSFISNSRANNKCYELGLSVDNIDLVIDGMIQACSAGGTAFPFFERNAKLLSTSATTISSKLSTGAAACKTGTAEFGGADSQGYRRTHGWFTLIIQPQLGTTTDALESSKAVGEFQDEALVSDGVDWRLWREKIKQHPFPERVVMTVLVESDDEHPFREGSKDAAPLAKSIVTWMETGVLQLPQETAGRLGE